MYNFTYLFTERKQKHKEAAFQKAVNDVVLTQAACILTLSQDGKIIKVNSSRKLTQARTKRKATALEIKSPFNKEERTISLKALKAETEAKATVAKR